MPTPLTWNFGLVWNSSTSGAVWNGVANPTNPPHTMPNDNRISAEPRRGG